MILAALISIPTRGGKSWRSKIALIQVATAKFRREQRFPEASKCTAVIIAPTQGPRAVWETAVAVIRTAENEVIAQNQKRLHRLECAGRRSHRGRHSSLFCKIFFAFSSSRFRVIDKFLPARLIKYWIIRMPEPIPLGLTLFFAMVLAIVWASLVNKALGGSVETVFTLRTHFFGLAMALFIRDPLECAPLCEQRRNVL
jgi:hypothetical protein